MLSLFYHVIHLHFIILYILTCFFVLIQSHVENLSKLLAICNNWYHVLFDIKACIRLTDVHI